MESKIYVNLADGNKLALDLFWLRDHCRCPTCYNSKSSNRLSSIFDIPDDISAKFHSVVDNKLVVSWFDDHKSEYDLEFLLMHQPEKVLPPKTQIQLWDKKSFETVGEKCNFKLDDIVNVPEVKREVLRSLHVYGMAFIDGVNPTKCATEDLVTKFFPLQKTFFGEMFTFSEAAPDHHDTAYTNVYLAPHNDQTYFNDAAGLLELHCLHHDGLGGENYLIDAFQVAEKLRQEHPKSFNRLTKTIVGAEYKEEGRHHKYAMPIITIDPVSGELLQVRYNMDDRVPLTTVPADKIRNFYHDLKILTREFESEANRITFKLRPGTVLLFDNWRLLHGRLAYTGSRTVAGCYIARTEYQSSLRINGIIE